MALVACVECGKEFSDKAKACPNCGCPIELVLETIKKQNAQQEGAVNRDTVVDQNAQAADQTEEKIPPAVQSHSKTNLLSYREMRDFAFSSILPYLYKELNNTVTDVKEGTGKEGAAHYYLTCGHRVIGVKVVIDAYPDIYNVGKLFDDDIDEQQLAKSLYENGYECAVAKIGIGASDPIRFARRVFLKNDSYYFNYQQLRFVAYNPQRPSNKAESQIKYSLSWGEKDESWKKIAGFKYTSPPKRVNEYIVQKSTPKEDPTSSRMIREFWDDDYNVTGKIEKLCEGAYIQEGMTSELSKLICYAASTAHDRISPEDMRNYICNAVDYLTGVFLSDSTPVASDEILVVLRELFANTKLEEKYELECNEVALINYLIFLFITDQRKFAQFFAGDYLVEHKGKRLSSIGYIYHATKDAFIANPCQFGYGQDVVDEIHRIQNINSPQNLEKCSSMRTAIEKEMRQFCIIHEKVLSKKTLQLLKKSDDEKLSQFSQNAHQLQTFIQRNFDETLADNHKKTMAVLTDILRAYKLCLGMDSVIIGKQLRGKYRLFERLDDAKESKIRYDKFMQLVPAILTK